MLALSGKTILQLRKRLGEDWPDLALYFEIPQERCKGFMPRAIALKFSCLAP